MRTTALIVLAAMAAGCGNRPSDAGVSLATVVQRADWPISGGGQQITSAHYRLYTNASSRHVTVLLSGFMEAARGQYLRITSLPEPAPREPMNLYVMANRSDWADLTRHITGRQSDIFLSIDSGGYCHNGVCVLWDMGPLGTFSVAAHEGMHQFLHHQLAQRLPMWLEEGLCTLTEGFELEGETVRFTPRRNVARFNDLRAAIVQQRWIPLSRLVQMDAGDAVMRMPHEAVGYYGQVWALALFMQSRPDLADGLARLLLDARDGELHRSAGLSAVEMNGLLRRGREYNRRVSLPLFRHYMGADPPGLERQYRAFAMKLARLE